MTVTSQVREEGNQLSPLTIRANSPSVIPCTMGMVIRLLLIYISYPISVHRHNARSDWAIQDKKPCGCIQNRHPSAVPWICNKYEAQPYILYIYNQYVELSYGTLSLGFLIFHRREKEWDSCFWIYCTDTCSPASAFLETMFGRENSDYIELVFSKTSRRCLFPIIPVWLEK